MQKIRVIETTKSIILLKFKAAHLYIDVVPDFFRVEEFWRRSFLLFLFALAFGRSCSEGTSKPGVVDSRKKLNKKKSNENIKKTKVTKTFNKTKRKKLTRFGEEIKQLV